MTTVKITTDKILFGLVLVVLVFALFQAFQLNSLKTSLQNTPSGAIVSQVSDAPQAVNAMSHGASQGFSLSVPDSSGCAPS